MAKTEKNRYFASLIITNCTPDAVTNTILYVYEVHFKIKLNRKIKYPRRERNRNDTRILSRRYCNWRDATARRTRLCSGCRRATKPATLRFLLVGKYYKLLRTNHSDDFGINFGAVARASM